MSRQVGNIGEEGEIRLAIASFKGKLELLGQQMELELESLQKCFAEQKARLDRLNNCPCPVYRDPGHECLIIKIMERLTKLESRLAWYLGAALGIWTVLQVIIQVGLRLYFR